MPLKIYLDDEVYDTIADEVEKRLRAKYNLTPKQDRPTLIGLEQFRRQYGHNKAAAWIKLYLLPKMPGVFGLNAGKGHPVKIDVKKATEWLSQHEEEIDWNQSLPR